MPELQGYLTFPGVQQVLEASFTLAHGIQPSVCILEIQPQADPIADVGPLVLLFGETTIVFPDCRVDQASFRYGPNGLILSLALWDRRWRWQWGEVSGTFNERIPVLQFGSIDAYTLESGPELCARCLDAMGEVGYDVSQVPDNIFPEVRWVNDNPARALSDLADRLGCRVVLRADNRVMVARLGIGADLPADFLMQDALMFKSPMRPDTITVIGGATRYQADFLLEPVGQDVDGTVKHINDLSYKPAAGWGLTKAFSPSLFMGLPRYIPDLMLPELQQQLLRAQNPSQQDLAINSVFRWYRISNTACDQQGQTPAVPGWFGGVAGFNQFGNLLPNTKPTVAGSRILDIWQVLPIEDVQAGSYVDTSGLYHALPALIAGQWTDNHAFGYNRTGNWAHFDEDHYTIDGENGIVKFDDSVCIIQLDVATPVPAPWSWEPAAHQPAAKAVCIPAQLFLRVAFSVRDSQTSAFDRFRQSLEFPPPLYGTPTRILKREEIVLTVIPQYDGNHNVVSLTTNIDNCIDWANRELQQASLEYQLPTPQDRTYMGLLAVSPDGAIRQVTWSVGPAGATTRASRHTEHHLLVRPYKEQRQLDRLADMAGQREEILSAVRDHTGRQPPRGTGQNFRGQG